MIRTPSLPAAAALAWLAACASPLPQEAPPLADMEEPIDLLAEPDDEPARRELPPGCFTGADVEGVHQTLEERLAGEGGGVQVARVVENSPADAARLRPGDVLLEAAVDDGGPVALVDPSDWRRIELQAPAGARVRVVLDRAGVEHRTELVLVARVRPAERDPAERLREEDRVGIVLRTATEVEARAAGLGPGAGAVVVGLAHGSPWRTDGLRFGDLLTAVDGQPVSSPQVVLQAIRNAADAVAVRFVRAGTTRQVEARVSNRAGEVREILIPLLYSYRSERGSSETSALLGLYHLRSTPVAWRLRLLWLFTFGAGESDRLIEVPPR